MAAAPKTSRKGKEKVEEEEEEEEEIFEEFFEEAGPSEPPRGKKRQRSEIAVGHHFVGGFSPALPSLKKGRKSKTPSKKAGVKKRARKPTLKSKLLRDLRKKRKEKKAALAQIERDIKSLICKRKKQ